MKRLKWTQRHLAHAPAKKAKTFHRSSNNLFEPRRKSDRKLLPGPEGPELAPALLAALPALALQLALPPLSVSGG
eukprot:123994-Alexandrium_andersonii.AAC.1